MAMSEVSLLDQVSQNDALVERLERELRQARSEQRQLHEAALKEICPFDTSRRPPEEQRFIPLGPTQALLNPVFQIRSAGTPNGIPVWEASGQEVRFRLGRPERVRQSSIDQTAFEALPEEVRSMTYAAMVERTARQDLVGMDKPLKLTPRQLEMFTGLAHMASYGKPAFDPLGKDGGQRLPHGVWGSVASTLEIWRAMVKRGVFILVDGDPTISANWLVNPGPRFQEAIEMASAQAPHNSGYQKWAQDALTRLGSSGVAASALKEGVTEPARPARRPRP